MANYNNITVKMQGIEVQISLGNQKMTSGFMIFNLPCRITCPGKTAMCSKFCYAAKREYNPRWQKTVHARRMKNLEAANSSLFVELTTKAIEKAIKKTGSKFLRIHESGDFYNQAYLDKWVEVVSRFPEIKFLAFTKTFQLDYSQVPSNLQIVWSIWSDTDMSVVPEYGYRSHAGDCGRGNSLECPGTCDNCGMCWNLNGIGRDVHFDIH